MSWYQKGKTKTNLDFLELETVSSSGITWSICKSASRPSQITTPAPQHSVLPAGRHSCRPTNNVKAHLMIMMTHFHSFITHTQHTTVLLLVWNMSGSTRVSRYQKGKTKKVKTNLDLLEQEIVSVSGICWAICKSAPHADNHANIPPLILS